MGLYRKKPVVIEAWQNLDDAEWPEWVQNADVGREPGGVILINTLEGVMKANLLDWIIRGVNGEVYPCKPDIFEKTYEPVEDEYQVAPESPRWTEAIENARFMLEEYKKIPTGIFGATVIAHAIARYDNGERSMELLEELEGIQ